MEQTKKRRIYLLDELRCIALIAMIIYHACYDIALLFPGAMTHLYSTPMRIFQVSIGITFTAISGISGRLSRNNVKRGAVCFACGLLLSAVTLIVMPDQAVTFGILHMLGISMILYGLLRRFLDRINSVVLFSICLVLFALTYRFQTGFVGLPYLFETRLPSDWLSTSFLFPLGLPGPTFFSSDYYPLIPWFFLFLCGTCLGKVFAKGTLPGSFYRKHIPGFAAAGSHTLLIYLLHQPILYGFFMLVAALI